VEFFGARARVSATGYEQKPQNRCQRRPTHGSTLSGTRSVRPKQSAARRPSKNPARDEAQKGGQ
jgi:hypothetical protein